MVVGWDCEVDNFVNLDVGVDAAMATVADDTGAAAVADVVVAMVVGRTVGTNSANPCFCVCCRCLPSCCCLSVITFFSHATTSGAGDGAVIAVVVVVDVEEADGGGEA